MFSPHMKWSEIMYNWMTTVRPTSSRNFIQVLDWENTAILDLPAIEVLVYQSLVTSVKNLQNLIVLWKKNLEKNKDFQSGRSQYKNLL